MKLSFAAVVLRLFLVTYLLGQYFADKCPLNVIMSAIVKNVPSYNYYCPFTFKLHY